MKIVLMGQGEILYNFANQLDAVGLEIIALVGNKGCEIEKTKLIDLKCKPIISYDYEEVIKLKLKPDLFLMYSYAPLIKEEYFQHYLFINIHATLLPRYRGFHGLIWSMINDENYMGYTMFKINNVIDGGEIYFQHKIQLTDEKNMIDIRKEMEDHMVNNIGNYILMIGGGATSIAQDDSKAIYVTRRSQDEGEIDWSWSARVIFNHIRALVPPITPGAFTWYKEKKVILIRAKYIDVECYFSTQGKIVNITPEGSIYVKCGDGVIEITQIAIGDFCGSPNKVFGQVGVQLGNKQRGIYGK